MAKLENQRLLIAEDDDEMRAWLKLLLDGTGMEILQASSGWELLDTVAEAGPFGLIITDVRMPGPSGLQVVEMARATGLETPFLVITAFPEEKLKREAANLESVTLLEKPFARTELLGAIDELLATG